MHTIVADKMPFSSHIGFGNSNSNNNNLKREQEQQ